MVWSLLKYDRYLKHQKRQNQTADMQRLCWATRMKKEPADFENDQFTVENPHRHNGLDRKFRSIPHLIKKAKNLNKRPDPELSLPRGVYFSNQKTSNSRKLIIYLHKLYKSVPQACLIC